MLGEVGHLIEHALSGDVEDAADDDSTGFACGVDVNRDEWTCGSHLHSSWLASE
jgi:hypothetical protein